MLLGQAVLRLGYLCQEPNRIETEKEKNGKIGRRIHGFRVVRSSRQGFLGFSGVGILFPLDFSPYV